MPVKRLYPSEFPSSTKRRLVIPGFDRLSLSETTQRNTEDGVEDSDKIETTLPAADTVALIPGSRTIDFTTPLFIREGYLKHLKHWTPIKYYNFWKVLYDSYAKWCLRQFSRKTPRRIRFALSEDNHRYNYWDRLMYLTPNQHIGFSLGEIDMDLDEIDAEIDTRPLETSTPPSLGPDLAYSGYGSYYENYGSGVFSPLDQGLGIDVDLEEERGLEIGDQTLYNDTDSSMEVDT
ncbi:hypothetical protein BABINDRAFT_169392 [Babjeviella inositovora NRRL Y-12698]|uniref:Uncharacterized protein n=1 Tax=Babjeviella inositovora NRRL Y-12698 TaxID=984486 RepID=A0A1E3QIZ9_9ASCO|nr:uncharacterized protein BABINDRAFT_169392 [Babjeviella inositovora NRRL Y-12698]ODQ77042.1 hypothetical protein BABINDRAFT_169392 [Babjeviella inositovora NRRL Y-12698]